MIAPVDGSETGGQLKAVFTTGQVAEICNVAPRTVSKWFDSGQLKGYRIPGSRDRRIPLRELMRFMRAHGIPLGKLGVSRRAVLVVDTDPARYRRLSSRLSGQGVEMKVVDNCVAAGAALAWSIPMVVVINFSTVVAEESRVGKWLKREPWTRSVVRVGLVSPSKLKASRSRLMEAGFEHVLPADCPVEEILAIIDQAGPG